MRPIRPAAAAQWLRPGDHAVLLCGNPHHWGATVIAFLAEGFARGEPVVYLNGIYPEIQVRGLMEAAGIARDGLGSAGSICIRPANQVLAPNGVFDDSLAKENLGRLVEESAAKAAAKPRLLLDMNWGSYLRMGVSQLMECERWLDGTFIPQHGCLTLCHYERMLFTPMVLGVLAERHAVVLDDQVAGDPFCAGVNGFAAGACGPRARI